MKKKSLYYILFFEIILFQAAVHCERKYVLSAFEEVVGVSPSPVIQIKLPYNINPDFCVTAASGSGSVTYSRPFAVLSISGTTGSSATFASKNRIDYRCGQGTVMYCTPIFTTGVTGTTQIVGLGNTVDGYFFGYTGTEFGVLRRANSVDTWAVQSSWNGDKVDGSSGTAFTLNPTLGNVYKIQLQWLGFGVIKFFVEDPSDGSWVLVHTIEYPNSATETSTINASFQAMATISNTVNSPNVTLQIPSMAALTEGRDSPNLYNYTYRNATGTNAAVGTTLVRILDIQNIATFTGMSGFVTGQANQTMVYLENLSVTETSGGGELVAIMLFKNPTLSGASYTPVDGAHSVVLRDVAATITSPGTPLATRYLGIVNSTRSFFWELKDYNIWLAPGDVLLVAGLANGGSNSILVSLQWLEKQ
jgi:hypothetical protein